MYSACNLIDYSNGTHLSLTYQRRTGTDNGSGNAMGGYTVDGITYNVETSDSLSNAD